MTVLRLRVFSAIVIVLVTVWVISLKPAPTAASRAPTVANYLARIARAMGLDGRLGPRASADEYLRLLVQQRTIPATVAQGLRTDQGLTSDLVLKVSSGISDPLAPAFLSKTYVASAFLASHGAGVGLVRFANHGNEDLFNARTHHSEDECVTPNEDNDDNDDDQGENHNGNQGDQDEGHHHNAHHSHHGHHDVDRCPEED